MTFLVDAHHLGLHQTGNETWTRNMARSLAALAAPGELEYAVSRAGRDELERLTGGARPVHLVSGRSAVRLAVDLPRLLRGGRFDALLVTYTAPPTRVPVVVAVHDLSMWDPASSEWLPAPTRVRLRATIRATCRRAAAVLVLSEATKEDVVRTLGVAPERVRVAPCAVDPDLAARLAAAGSAAPLAPAGAGHALTVLTVGNVVPRKNLTVLAEAVRACRDGGVAVRLRIVGQVPAAGRSIAAAVTERLGSDVVITGYASPAQLAAEYVSADVFCFPSRFEGFGLPVVEAMAAGLPVVVSDIPPLRETAADAALRCPPGDVRAWTEAIRQVATDDGLRASLVRRGAERVAGLSWEASAQVVLGALRDAAAAGPRRT